MMFLVTSFTPDLYQQYAQNFLQSFHKNWPDDTSLLCYLEGFTTPPFSSDRVHFRDILTIPGWLDFQNRHKAHSAARGAGPRNEAYQVRFDAVRFSHKALALADACLRYRDVQDYCAWVGSDVIVHSKVPTGFLRSLLPGNTYTAILGRKHNRHNRYHEADFVGVNLKHEQNVPFMTEYKDFYLKDTIFDLEAWHDAWPYMILVDKYQREGKIMVNDLSSHFSSKTSHVFVNSILGNYMDHLKGDRKTRGRTDRRELLKPSANPYWR